MTMFLWRPQLGQFVPLPAYMAWLFFGFCTREDCKVEGMHRCSVVKADFRDADSESRLAAGVCVPFKPCEHACRV
jgi:hypothetical protein